MDILTKYGEILKAIFVKSQEDLLRSSKDTIAAEKALWHWWCEIACHMIAWALEAVDASLYEEYKEKGWRIERRDTRTVQCLFGPLTYKRRLLEKPGSKAKPFYPLDHKLGLEAGMRYSLAMMDRIAQIMSMTTCRNTSRAISLLTQLSVSHQTVVSIKNYAGKKAEAFEEAVAENKPEEKQLPKGHILAIEGDGIEMKMQGNHGKGEKGGRRSELHRVQVYEGVRKNGRRTELIGCRCFSGRNRSKVVKQVTEFLHNHYDIGELTILSNGDGGSGYSYSDFAEMTEGCKRHEHFRDRYHVNEKVRTRLSFCQKGFVNSFIRALGQCSNVMKEMAPWLNTAESLAKTREDKEQVEMLRKYLERHGPYIPGLSQRKIDTGDTEIHLGTAESGHRYYSFRMKKQGRCWSDDGMEAMASVMTAMKNGELEQALLYKAAGTNYKKIDRTLRKAATKAAKSAEERRQEALSKRRAQEYRPGCIEGRIAVYGPTSSPMGQLAKAIQNW